MAMHKDDEAQRERAPVHPTQAPEPGTHGEAAAPRTGTNRAKGAAAPAGKPDRRKKNNVRKIRLERMMSKAELARRAAVSTLTIDRIERGMPCRMDTKRKILEALGLSPSDREMVFGPDDGLPDEASDDRPVGPAKTDEPPGRDD